MQVEPSTVAAVSINAAPGYFHQVEFPFQLPSSGKDKSVFTASLVRLQASSEWAPVLSVCVQGHDPDWEQACLGLYASQDGKTVTPTQFETDGKKAPNPRRQHFEATKLEKNSFKILVEQDAGTVRFYLNGVLMFEAAHVSEPTGRPGARPGCRDTNPAKP